MMEFKSRVYTDRPAYADFDAPRKIDKIIKLKHEYNKSRPYKHGGKKI